MAELTAEQLAERAFDLGLLDARELERVWSELGSRNVTLDQFRSLLLRRELMTNWQLERLMEGRQTGYFYGRYKILYLVGSGTFARVYRAVNIDTGEVAAVKVLRQRYSDDIARTQQFMREARTVMPLRHPNIVPIHEVTEENGRFYMVMDFVEGQNLRDWLRRSGRLSLYDAISVAADVAAGLDYALQKGVLHRDIKNSNILVSSRGRAALVDFGLAAVDGQVTESNVADIPNPRSIDYAGLERASGVPKDDKRSDIFFVGCSLYHMLTGHPPLAETRDRIQRLNKARYLEIPPITDWDPELPARVVMVVNKAMEIRADKRFQTPGEMLAELNEIKAMLDPEKDRVVRSAPAVRRPKEEEKKPREGQSRTVMVVDSNAQIQDALRSGLKELGYRVLIISDPQRALKRFEFNEPAADCVVFGTYELGIRALNAFNAFAEDEWTQNIPAILLVDDRQKAQATKEARLADHRVIITLPLKFEQFRATLRDLLAAASTES